jgi:hypothetical protein
MVFEEDLTRDSLNRLIQRMDEELTMSDELGKEEYSSQLQVLPSL